MTFPFSFANYYICTSIQELWVLCRQLQPLLGLPSVIVVLSGHQGTRDVEERKGQRTIGTGRVLHNSPGRDGHGHMFLRMAIYAFYIHLFIGQVVRASCMDLYQLRHQHVAVSVYVCVCVE